MLTWTTPRVRHPEQADRWTWLVLLAYIQLRLARRAIRRSAPPLGAAPAPRPPRPHAGPCAPGVSAAPGRPRHARHRSWHGTSRRTDRAAVGAAGAAPAARETGDGPTERRPSSDHQWHPVARAHRRPLERLAGAVRPLVDGVQPLLAVAAGRGVGPGLRGRPAGGGRGRGGRLERPVRRRQRDPGAPARGRGKGGRRKPRRWARARAASRPRSTSRPRGAASR
jgi:hypothetical protein